MTNTTLTDATLKTIIRRMDELKAQGEHLRMDETPEYERLLWDITPSINGRIHSPQAGRTGREYDAAFEAELDRIRNS